MSSYVKVESSKVDEMLNNLNNQERMKSIIKEALTKGAEVMKRSVQSLFKSSFAGANYISNVTKKPFYETVRVRPDKKNPEDIVVDILGDFRAKFFEKGTKLRWQKGAKVVGYTANRKRKLRKGKGRFTGKVEGYYFFKRGTQQSLNQVSEAIYRSLDAALGKGDK